MRVAPIMLGGALASAACGNDGGKQAQPAEAGSGGGAGMPAETNGGRSSGEAGMPSGGSSEPTGEAGSAQAGQAGAGNPGIAIEEFCELDVRAREWLRECRFGFGDHLGWWGANNIAQFCSSGRAAVEDGRLIYDPIAAEACRDASLGDCNSIAAFAFGLAQRNAFGGSDECQGVLTGTVELGDPCHARSTVYSSECVTGFCSEDACPGTCTKFSGPGDSCDGTSSRCDPATSFCNARGKCEEHATVGESCVVAPCEAGTLCHFDEQQQTRLCVELIAVGGDCELALSQCEGTAVCYEGKCAEEVHLGEACVTPSNCPDDAYCEGICKAYADVNGDCTTAYCPTGTTCVELTCVPLGQTNDDCPCDTGFWCDDDSKCRAQGQQGDDCTQTTTVGSGSRCELPLTCVPSSLEGAEPAAYECQPPGALDDFCLPQYLGTCQVPLFCDPGTFTCQEPGAEDAACNFAFPLDSCEQGLHCTCTSNCAPSYAAVATCKPRLDDDEACMTPQQCMSGICDEQCKANPACL